MIDEYIAFIENGGIEYQYHPATEYQLAPFSLTNLYVKKQEDGFNIRTNGVINDVSSKKKIYCFGGSTTYGSFLKDSETWPAYLEKGLDSVAVLNYGVPGFVPTQETNQFIHLLKQGYRPSLCIFMDGVNLGPAYDGSDFTKSIYQKFNENYLEKNTVKQALAQLPLVKVIQGKPLHEPLDLFRSKNIDFMDIETTDENNSFIVQRFIANAKIREEMAALYKVKIIQFLQANAYYDYPEEHLSELATEYHQKEHTKNLEDNTQFIYKKVLMADCGYEDLSPLFQAYDKPALVDFIHYSPDFNKFLAQYIVKEYVKNIVLDDFEVIADKRAGLPFEIID
jgi:hypothetical protein